MSQHDFVIADQTMPSARTDINSALQALASLSAGSTAPTTTYAYMPWLDTSATPYVLKIRDGADSAWITALSINDSTNLPEFDASDVQVADSGGLFTGTEVETVLAELFAATQGKHMLWVPASAMTPTATNGATSGTTELATNDVPLAYLDFDPSTAQYAGFNFQAPKSTDEATAITVQFFWTTADTAGTGNVVWGASMLATGDNDAMDSSFGTEQTVTDGYLATKDCHLSSETSGVTPAGSWAEGDIVHVKIRRVAASGSDTYTQDARLLGARITLTTDANTDD